MVRAECAVCRRPSVHALCPPCQARHNAAIRKANAPVCMRFGCGACAAARSLSMSDGENEGARSKDTPATSLPPPDEDADLELVYPEDVACSPPPKPRTRPLLLHDTPTDDGTPCTVGDWKQRNFGVPPPPRLPSASSMITTTTMEEKEVATMLDDMEMSDADECDLPPSPSSPGRDTSSELIGNHIPGWDSDLTDLSDLDTDSVSDTGSEPQEDTTSLKIRIPLLMTRLPPGSPLRKCGNKRCNIALPKHHRWKTCDPCRSAQRVYQRTRCENIRRRILGLEEMTLPNITCRRWRSLSPEMRETGDTLTAETSRPCAGRHCRVRIPLVEIYRWKTCIKCRARARREARRKRDMRIENELVPRFSAYQNRGSLLASFDAQLRGFIEGQLWYLRAKLRDEESRRESISHAPMQFMFVGEYAVVTGQRGLDGEGKRQSPERDHDPAADVGAMRQEVSIIVAGLERVLRTTFKTNEAFVIESGGILSRFTCSLELIAQLHPLGMPDSDSGPNSSTTDAKVPNDQQPAVPLVKTLSGELEAVIVPDDSHRLFYGQRTVIRYRMVG